MSETNFFTSEVFEQAVQVGVQRDIDARTDENTGIIEVSMSEFEAIPLHIYPLLHEANLAAVKYYADWGIDYRSIVRDTMFINTGTEDNLEYYHSANKIGMPNGAMQVWNNTIWTPQEKPHGRTGMRLIEATALSYSDPNTEFPEKGFDRPDKPMEAWHIVSEENTISGIHIDMETAVHGFVYVSPQELLTKKAWFNAGGLFDYAQIPNIHEIIAEAAEKNIDFIRSSWNRPTVTVPEVVEDFMDKNYAMQANRRISSDEGRHFGFYNGVLAEIAPHIPDLTLVAMQSEHGEDEEGKTRFDMPGIKGIPGFVRMAMAMRMAGIFDDLTVIDAQTEVTTKAGLLSLEPKTEDGKVALEWLHAYTSPENRANAAQNLEDKRDKKEKTALEKRVKTGKLLPFILDRTVTLKSGRFSPIKNVA